MYEMNLVPDVKTELLEKPKLRNLVSLVCIVLSAASAGVVALLGGIAATQAITIAAKDNEIKCRSTGDGSGCNNTGTAVYKFSNVGELLTMQGQMYDLQLLNSNRLVLSRIFPMFDVILPNGDEGTVKVSQVVGNFEEMTFTIEANSKDSIGYNAREAFRKGLLVTYYDYGHYMREDAESGGYVEIPSYCIKEETIDGYLYGRYFKGKPGCESDLIEKSSSDGDDLDEEESINGTNKYNNPNTEVEDNDFEEILIRRTYEDEQDLSDYKAGKDKLAKLTDKVVKGYYFESQCIRYKGDGKLDEDATLALCGLASEEPKMIDGSFGRNDKNQMVLTFSAQFYVKKDAFLGMNKHMIFVGPTKRNVTDSYVPVRDMFSASETVVEKEDTK